MIARVGPSSSTVQIVLRTDLRAWLLERAGREGLSLSSYLRRLVVQHVREVGEAGELDALPEED